MDDNKEVLIRIWIKDKQPLRILGSSKDLALILKNLIEEDK